MSKIDLHMHSNFSDDGEYTPTELVEIATQQGVSVIAIADHDNTQGVAEGLVAAKAAGITLIPAIEIGCFYQGINLHILGYNINHLDPRYALHFQQLMDQEEVAGEKRMELIEELGIILDKPLIRRIKHLCITGELISETALADPVNDDNPLLLPYRPGGSRSEAPHVNFYWDFLSQGQPAYVETSMPSLVETVQLIKSTGGTVILAHPGMQVHESEELLDGIIASGVEGIEAFSSYHRKEQDIFYRDYCLKNNLLITCGSDFHGKYKPHIQMGSTSSNLVIDKYLELFLR